MIERRLFLQSASAAAALAGLGLACPPVSSATAQAGGDAEARLKRLMDHIYENILLADPEVRTSLGLDKGQWASAKSKLYDRSARSLARDREKVKRAYADLRSIDRAALSGPARIDYDMLVNIMERSPRLMPISNMARSVGPNLIR